MFIKKSHMPLSSQALKIIEYVHLLFCNDFLFSTHKKVRWHHHTLTPNVATILTFERIHYRHFSFLIEFLPTCQPHL